MQRLITVNGLQLCLYHRPGPGESVVFVHGLTDNGASWNRVVERMSPYFDIITYDLRAHGLSGATPSGYAAVDHASDLLGLLEQMDIHSTILVGHSLGAEICAHVAQQSSARVTRLVLVDPPWHLDSMRHSLERRNAIVKGWYDWQDQFSRMSRDEVLSLARLTNPRWHADDMETWASARQQVRRCALEYLAVAREPWQALIGSLRCPTLIVFGEAKRGAAVSVEQVAEACSLSEYIVSRQIHGAGHAIYRDSLDEFMKILTEFIRC